MPGAVDRRPGGSGRGRGPRRRRAPASTGAAAAPAGGGAGDGQRAAAGVVDAAAGGPAARSWPGGNHTSVARGSSSTFDGSKRGAVAVGDEPVDRAVGDLADPVVAVSPQRGRGPARLRRASKRTSVTDRAPAGRGRGRGSRRRREPAEQRVDGERGDGVPVEQVGPRCSACDGLERGQPVLAGPQRRRHRRTGRRARSRPASIARWTRAATWPSAAEGRRLGLRRTARSRARRGRTSASSRSGCRGRTRGSRRRTGAGPRAGRRSLGDVLPSSQPRRRKPSMNSSSSTPSLPPKRE